MAVPTRRMKAAVVRDDAAGRRIVLFVHSLGYLRFFDSVIRRLLDHGAHVHLLVERDDHEPNELRWLAEMGQRPHFTYSVTKALATDRWGRVATKLRRASDYLRFRGPEFRETPHLVARSRGRVSRWFASLSDWPFLRTEGGRQLMLRAILLIERAVPSNLGLEHELASLDPDVVVVCPHLMPGERHSEYVKSARALGIPTCVCIASWDNLSSKQLLREIPDCVIVWNAIQQREAEQIHGVPGDRVVVTGAQNFDQWFTWRARERATFAGRVGIDPGRPYVLYLAGSLFPARLTEAEWVRDVWLPAVRAHTGLGHLGVLARPHPSRMPEWVEARLEELDGVAVWPRGGNEMPVDGEARADYYDSIYHSEAVVGLNTSGMIEAAIVGRPVLTLLVPEFRESQVGTFHFDYLLTVGGGLPRLASTLGEHLEQLRETVEHGDPEAAERNRRFVETFVRPRGLDRDATGFVVDAIEELAEGTVEPARRRDVVLLPVRAVLLAYLYSSALAWKLSHGFGREASSGSS